MGAQPGVGDVYVKKTLSDASVGYKNPLYIAGEIAPAIMVMEQAGYIPKYTKSYWARASAQPLAPMQPPPISGFEVEMLEYMCRVWGIGDAIPDEVGANQDPPFNDQVDAAEWVTDQLLLSKEVSFLTNFWKTGVWGTDKVGTVDFTKWSVYATSHPLVDLRGFKRTIKTALLGREANTLVLGDMTFDVLADHPDFMDTVKYGSSSDNPARVTPNLIAQLLGVERVLKGSVVYTASPEGTAEGSVTYTRGYDDDAFLAYIAPRPSKRTPSALYTLIWQTLYGGSRYVRMRREPMADRGWLVEGFEAYTIKALSTDAGLFISDAVD